MNLKTFIRENRTELDQFINAAIYRHDGKGGRGTIPSPAPRYSDRERELWIKNEEGLYNWARSAGCRI